MLRNGAGAASQCGLLPRTTIKDAGFYAASLLLLVQYQYRIVTVSFETNILF